MLTIQQLLAGFQSLPLRGRPVIAHGSFKSFGMMQGGPKAVIDALIASSGALVMPTFTYKTMVTPQVGPPNNGLTYGNARDLNRMAEPFHSDLPADPLMGALSETLRRHPSSKRTLHPILSFAGVRADAALDRQTLLDPLAPIGALAEQDGWVVLIGVDHTVNTSIHYAEKLAGRRQFVRWATTKNRIIECPGFPGDSFGFQQVGEYLENDVEQIQLGGAIVRALPLLRLFDVVKTLIKVNPLALLCQREDCERCRDVRLTS